MDLICQLMLCYLSILIALYILPIGCLKKQKNSSKAQKFQPPLVSTATELSIKDTSLCSCSNPSASITSKSSMQGGSHEKICNTHHASSCQRSKRFSGNLTDKTTNLKFLPTTNPRKSLPYDQIPGNAVSFWDLAKMKLPIHVFEPLTILQVLCEELRFAGRFLNSINDVKEPEERMLLVVTFIISAYTGLSSRKRKPFNPLLGETFDFVCEDFKYHAEQVSHHPPISAVNASDLEDKKWNWFQTFEAELVSGLDNFSIEPMQPVRLRLSNGDEYSWNKVRATVENVRSEANKRVVKNQGLMTIEANTGIEARVNFLPDSSNSLEGEIRNRSTGKVLHKLVGSWDTGISRVTKSDKHDVLFKAKQNDEKAARQYGFNEFTVQLNEIVDEQLSYLPKTDSRLRPDVRHLENAKPSDASDMKKQLENEQRSRKSKEFKPMWFEQKQDTFADQKLWLSNDKYWKSKAECFEDNYSHQMLQLFCKTGLSKE